MNLGLPKAFIQLFRVQNVYSLFTSQAFQIRFCDFSGVLPHSQTTCSKFTACNPKDRNPDVQRQQSMWFNVIIGNNRKFEQYKSLLYKFHSNMGFPKVDEV